MQSRLLRCKSVARMQVFAKTQSGLPRESARGVYPGAGVCFLLIRRFRILKPLASTFWVHAHVSLGRLEISQARTRVETSQKLNFLALANYFIMGRRSGTLCIRRIPGSAEKISCACTFWDAFR